MSIIAGLRLWFLERVKRRERHQRKRTEIYLGPKGEVLLHNFRNGESQALYWERTINQMGGLATVCQTLAVPTLDQKDYEPLILPALVITNPSEQVMARVRELFANGGCESYY
jgi:hypothetical protein